MSAQAKPIDNSDVPARLTQGTTTESDSDSDKSLDEKLSKVNTALVSEVAANDDNKADASNNLIKRTVDEICGLMADVRDIREELLARDVRFHMLNALIEMGVHDKHEELEKMVTTAVEASVKAHGTQAIGRAEFVTHLEIIVALEKDLRHVRHLASQQGINRQALNQLTQLMHLNPGDGGVQAINTFVAYADAAGISLDRFKQIRAQFTEEVNSVLPDISRDGPADNRDAWVHVGSNVLLGLVLTGIVMWMVL